MRVSESSVFRLLAVAGVWVGASMLAGYILAPFAGHAAVSAIALSFATAVAGAFGSLLSLSLSRLRALSFWRRLAFVSAVAIAPVALFFGSLAGLSEPVASASLIAPFALGALLVAALVDRLFGPRTSARASSAT